MISISCHKKTQSVKGNYHENKLSLLTLAIKVIFDGSEKRPVFFLQIHFYSSK